eukprot:c11274_g1_i1.p1 GENE.c11274_g1_i1~~c11274_g1_i1.p1  ORF type:complete len:780 (+),score=156.82 c11274_g1_i1:2-2341(+)
MGQTIIFQARARPVHTRALTKLEVYRAFIELMFPDKATRSEFDQRAMRVSVAAIFSERNVEAETSSRASQRGENEAEGPRPDLQSDWLRLLEIETNLRLVRLGHDQDLMADHSPLLVRKSEDELGFSDPTFVDYYAALALVQDLFKHATSPVWKLNRSLLDQKHLSRSEPITGFVADMVTEEAKFLNALKLLSSNTEPDVGRITKNFLLPLVMKSVANNGDNQMPSAEALATDGVTSRLFDMVHASRYESCSAKFAPANALTALNLAGVHFGLHAKGRNLRDVKIDGADLREARLTGVNLAGAMLTNVSAQHARLFCVDMSGASMAGTVFGLPTCQDSAEVRSVAFSPDGSKIASASIAKTIRLWDASTGEQIGVLQGHTGSVSSIAFGPDGTRLVSGSGDKTVILWDVAKCSTIGEPWSLHSDTVSSVAFSRDGSLVVSASEDGMLCLWNASTGEPIGDPLQNRLGAVNSVAFSPDGSKLVSTSAAAVTLWSVATKTPIKDLTDDVVSGQVRTAVFSPDGTIIASGTEDSKIRLWDVSTAKPIGEPMVGHTLAVKSVAFSPDGSKLASASEDMTLQVWDVVSAKAIGKPFEGHSSWVTSVAFSPDGSKLASGSGDATLRVWDVSTASVVSNAFPGHSDALLCVAYSQDGSMIATSSKDKTIRIWDAESARPIGKALTGHMDTVWCVAFSPDGTKLASGCGDSTIRLWDIATVQTVNYWRADLTTRHFAFATLPLERRWRSSLATRREFCQLRSIETEQDSSVALRTKVSEFGTRRRVS